MLPDFRGESGEMCELLDTSLVVQKMLSEVERAPLLASQEENEWPSESHTYPFAQPERTGIVRVHQQSQDQPGAKVEPSRRTTAPDRRAQAFPSAVATPSREGQHHPPSRFELSA
jgi:hypothetical protein